MYEIMCHCSWSIPGVEELPAHVHRTYITVTDGNREIRSVGIIPTAPWQLVGEEDAIEIWVSWKQVARALTLDETESAPTHEENGDGWMVGEQDQRGDRADTAGTARRSVAATRRLSACSPNDQCIPSSSTATGERHLHGSAGAP